MRCSARSTAGTCEKLLAERGVIIDHITIYRWVNSPRPGVHRGCAAVPGRAPGDRWFVDDTYLKVVGKWTYLYRAVDQNGQVIDVLRSTRRDLAAARRIFACAMGSRHDPGRGRDRPRLCLPVPTRRSRRRCTPSSSTRIIRSRLTTGG